MLNVLHIMDYAAPYKGNFIRSIKYLEQQLEKEGGRVIYLFPDKARNLEWITDLIQEKKKVYFIDSMFFSKKIIFKNINKLIHIIRREKINIIHTHFIAVNYSLFLIKLFFMPGIHLIGHFHSQYNPPANAYRKIKVMITRITCNLMVGVSKSVEEGLHRVGIPYGKLRHVSNAIEFNRLKEYDNYTIKDTPGQKVVLMIGWPYYIKGVDIALEAIRKMNGEKPDMILAVILAGEMEAAEQAVINQVGAIPKWLRFLPPRDDIASYLNSADIFLSASREEGFSYTLVEAAYCKPLLVSSDIPAPLAMGIPALRFFRTEDSNDLYNVLNSLRNSWPEDHLAIKEKQRQYVQDAFSLERWAAEIIVLYKQMPVRR
jgi:glycosyltransferase involved in cell wall biosynthesis